MSEKMRVIVKALETARYYVLAQVKEDGGIHECDISFRADLDLIDRALLAARGGSDE